VCFCMVLVIQLLFAANLMGLSWFIQSVHYPLFRQVPIEVFEKYTHLHQRKTSCVVAPLMLGEMLTGIWLLIIGPISLTLIILSILLLFNWVLTIGLAVPEHKKLSQKKSNQAINRLIAVHWLRTCSWSVRSLLLAYLLLLQLERVNEVF